MSVPEIVTGATLAAMFFTGIFIGRMASWGYRRAGLRGAIRSFIITAAVFWGAVALAALALVGLLSLVGWWP